MKFISFFPIMIVLVSGHYQQYLQNPFVTKLDGRSFGLFSMLNRNVDKTRLANLEATIATLQPQVSSLNSQFATAQASNIPVQSAIQAQLAPLFARLAAAEASIANIPSVQASIAALQTQLAATTSTANAAKSASEAATNTANAAAAPKCSAALAAIGGKLIENFCYTVGTTAKSFTAAQAACAANGGTLAEPTTPISQANGQLLYDAVKTPAVSAAASPNLWIGVVKPVGATTFSFASSGTALVDTTPTLFGAAGANTAAAGNAAPAGSPEAITLGPIGKYINELQSANRLYICQNIAV